MPFFLTNAVLLAALAGLGIPIAIHLLLKRRQVRMPFSTVRFFSPQEPQAKSRRKLRNLLLLLLRPLLLLHGTADDNVYFLHSVKLSDALFRAGKKHEFLPLAGFTHMVPDPLVTERLYRRIADFFIEHLQSP